MASIQHYYSRPFKIENLSLEERPPSSLDTKGIAVEHGSLPESTFLDTQLGGVPEKESRAKLIFRRSEPLGGVESQAPALRNRFDCVASISSSNPNVGCDFAVERRTPNTLSSTVLQIRAVSQRVSGRLHPFQVWKHRVKMMTGRAGWAWGVSHMCRPAKFLDASFGPMKGVMPL